MRDVVEQRSQMTGRVCVPGVGMHQVGIVHIGHHRQFRREIFHVHSGAAVHVGRKLPRTECDVESVTCLVGLGHLVTSWLLPTTVTPASETTNPRARSWSLSTPTCAPSGTTTSLSMIAFSTTALAPMTVLSRITERSTVA